MALGKWIRLLVAVSLLLPTTLHARQYALLVGVSSYPALQAGLQLRGPQNDVQLGKSILKDAGFAAADIRMLANGVKEANGEPTKQAILNELDALAARAQQGDYVYLQFGGHGSQQPAQKNKIPTETDGLDEIFLPVDVGQWDGSAGSVKNALRDDELGRKLDAIRAKGAFVWAVFDACHSGNITRGGSDPDTRERRADPSALGIPQALMDEVGQEAGHTRGGPAAPESALGDSGKPGGGYVYFYAAQTTETTPETRFPEGEADKKFFGVFTYTLAQVVRDNPGISYRQAGERVLQLYAARNIRVTPLFEGSGLDAPVFGQKPGDVVRQWKVVQEAGGLSVKAGFLQQFGVGAVLAVYPDSAARADAEPLGYLRADKVEVMQSRVSPLAYKGKPAAFEIPRDAVARLVSGNVNAGLRVALPPAIPKGVEYALAGKVIGKLRKSGEEGLKIEWVEAGKPADVRLMLMDDRKQPTDRPQGVPQLWLVASDGAWVRTGDGKTPSIKLDKSEQELYSVLAGELQTIGKAVNLMRIATDNGLATGSKLVSRFFVTRAKDGKREEIVPPALPVLLAGDKLQLELENAGYKPLDVTVLSIDANYGVYLLYPQSANELNRIQPRDTLTIPGAGQEAIEMDGKTSGPESIFVVAVEAEKGEAAVNLGYLEQPSLPATRGVRSADEQHAADVEDLFNSAAYGKTRGPNRAVAAARTTIKVFHYKAAFSARP